MAGKKKHILSKSSFMRSIQCKRSLYLYKNHYDLRDPMSEEQEAVFNRGHEVGRLAREIFPGGIDCTVSEPFNYSRALEETATLIEKGSPVLYEAPVQANNVLAVIDILKKEEDGTWSIYEVKSSGRIGLHHIMDAALQYNVAKAAGINVNKVFIIHLNKHYKMNGGINLKKLFQIVPVTRSVVNKQDQIKTRIHAAKETLQMNRLPKVEPGNHCFNPYPCDFINYCWKDQQENSIFTMNGLSKVEKNDYFARGIREIHEIPHEANHSPMVKLHLKCTKNDSEHIDRDNLVEFLSSLQYPLYFLDLESFMPAIPVFQGTHPYETMPFQFSLHKIEIPGASPQHIEFLAKEGIDPRMPLINRLKEEIGAEGNIIVFDKNAEKHIFKLLSKAFPEEADFLKNLSDRLFDLQLPFRKMYYYHPEMKGSISLKNITKAIIPDISFDNMYVCNGGIASVVYENLTFEQDPLEKARLRDELLQYCEKDTGVMVKILEILTEKAFR